MDSPGALSGVGLALAIIGGTFLALLVVGLLTLVLATVMRRLLGVPVGWPRTVIVAGVVVLSTVGVFGATLWDLTVTASDNDYFTGVNLPSSVLVLLIATLWMLGFGSAILMMMELIVPTGALPSPLRMATSFRSRRDRNRRYRQVLGVFMRNGLAAPFSRPRGNPSKEVAARFRRALEEAGTTFVKLGQNLSTRTDVLPSTFTDELSTLQSQARLSSWEVMEKEINAELDDRTADVFAWLDPEPLAAASVAQVHRGRLVDGTEVVVKVQRPGTREEVAKDSDILLEICAWLERATAWGEDIGITELARGFTDTLSEELDYTVEARNMEDLRAVLRGGPLTVPKAYPEHSTSRMLVMDYVPGPTVGAAAAELDDLDPKLRATLGQELLSSVMGQIMEHGVFHADVHPGNVTLIDDGEGDAHLGLLDFGAVGRIDRHTQHNLSVVFAAVDNGDTRLLVDALKALLGRPENLEEAELEKSVGTLLARYTTGRSHSIAGMVADVMAMVSEFRFSIPSSVASALRSLASVEGTLTLIDPHANIIDMARTDGAKLARTWMKPGHLKETLEATVLETLPMFRHLPRRVNAVVEDLQEGRLTLNMRFFSDRNDRKFITGMLQQFTVAILAGFTLLGGVVLLAFGTGGPPVTEEMSLLQAVGFIMLFAGFMMALRIVTMVLYRDDNN
jgi:ubiquinone biosynthesis protein